MFSLFETSVNGNVTFAYIITFDCTQCRDATFPFFKRISVFLQNQKIPGFFNS